MKEIVFSKERDIYRFDFYFSHNTQILLSTIGAVLVFSFTLIYLFKPLVNMNDNGFFLIAFFIASTLSMHFYKRLSWLSSRKRLEINKDEVLLYHAEHVVTRLPRSGISDVIKEKTRIFIFPLNAVVIKTESDSISIAGFKRGDDINLTAEKIKGIILQENQE